MTLEVLPGDFSVCRLRDISQVDITHDFTFVGKTDEELSLVCPTGLVPAGALSSEHGWRAMRITGELDFSLVGILADITRALAEQGISVFAISTFQTDYILVKGETLQSAVEALRERKYQILGEVQ